MEVPLYGTVRDVGQPLLGAVHVVFGRAAKGERFHKLFSTDEEIEVEFP